MKATAASAEQTTSDGHVTSEPAQLIRQFAICAALGISDETWRRWVKSGQAPQPVDMPGRPRWRVEDIEQFKRGRVVASDSRAFFGSAIRRRRA